MHAFVFGGLSVEMLSKLFLKSTERELRISSTNNLMPHYGAITKGLALDRPASEGLKLFEWIR